MKSLYTSAHSNTTTSFLTNRWIAIRSVLIRFIDRYAPTFVGLSRSATPFGGNWLTTNR
ncbi:MULTISPECIES: hypothetical protein [unclassified Spirosoma]|uniref:hypothetical protein n=1 Tax=unclassified Spirosoma TaxID=2621999 RepID=UPI001AD275ED|nr:MULTISPECIES: hypothetical protein [unclassified Spirosoma]MBN8821952.1 hypothetical protein [Spirosoma sp.]